MGRFLIRPAAAFLFFALSALGAVTVTITSNRVAVPEDGTPAVLKGTVAGYAITDYLIRARAGQTMSVAFKSSNGANHFSVLPPGSNDIAVFTGSVGGDSWSGTLMIGGDYRLRVYLMRGAARRNETADYTLSVTLSGTDGKGRKPAGGARIKAAPFDATGKVPCAMGAAPWGSRQCPFGVIRGTPGNAEIHLAPPRNFERVLTFADGNVTSDRGSTVKAEKHDDMWFIDVNSYERYQIPDAVILGN